MNILIIGGTGILSTAVVNSCVEKGYSVTMINRGNRSNQIHPKAKLIKCDVRDTSQLENITNKILYGSNSLKDANKLIKTSTNINIQVIRFRISNIK